MKNRLRASLWIMIIFMSLFLYKNKQAFFVYYNYAQYKVANGNSDTLFHLNEIISSAKESGYSCQNKYIPGDFAYQEIAKKRKNLIPFYPYKISNCVELPTGETLLKINDGIAKYSILLKIDIRKSKAYYILDIKGETLG